MAAEQFMLDRVVFSSPALTVKGWTGYTLSPGLQQTLNAGGSEMDPTLLATTASAPVIEGTTLDVGQFLGASASATGLFTRTDTTDPAIPHLAFAAAVDFWFVSASDGGTRGSSSTSTNTKMTLMKGVAIPVSLSNNADGLAELTVRFYADYDGTNVPVTFTADQTLPAGGAGANALWTVRALRNGTSGSILHRLQGINVDFGVGVTRDTPANAIYPTDTAVNSFRPVVRWRTTDIATALAASGFSGAVAGGGGFLVYIAQYATDAAGVQTSGALTLIVRTLSPWWTDGLTMNAGQLLALDYQCVGCGDDTVGDIAGGAEPPMQYAAGVSIAAILETTNSSLYMAGPIKDNATDINYATLRIDFGLAWDIMGEAHTPWPTHAALLRREPSIQVTTNHLDYVSALGLNGRGVDTTFTCYARKLGADSEPLKDAYSGSVHTALACTSGWILPSAVGGEHGALLQPEFLVRPTSGLTIDTSANIVRGS